MDIAAKLPDDHGHGRQPQPGAGRLAREVLLALDIRLQRPLDLLRRHRRAVIDHAERDAAGGRLGCRHDDDRCVIRVKLARIFQQFLEDGAQRGFFHANARMA